MRPDDQKENSPEAGKSQGNSHQEALPGDAAFGSDVSSKATPAWVTDIEQTLQLGEQFVGMIGGIVDLARMEALLAIRTLPKLVMVWLLLMPIMLLTWCAFSAMMAWAVFAASEEVGFGMLTFFLQQVLLLLICRWLYVKYRTRMTLPYTRAQIDSFVRSTQHEFTRKGTPKE